MSLLLVGDARALFENSSLNVGNVLSCSVDVSMMAGNVVVGDDGPLLMGATSWLVGSA